MANFISFLRMFLLVPVGILLYNNSYTAALWVFVVAALSDWLDGFIARKTNAVTETGKVIDQIADKVLITSTMIFLVDLKQLPVWLVVAVVWRDTMVSATRILAAKMGFIIAANMFGKAKTVSQMVLLILILAKDIIPLYEPVKILLIWIVFIFTVLSGIVYIYQNRRVFTI
ncbi:MAG: CDP-diacylglycerol--glycerol-3-phosphate 3-phosphatidyltransferase [Thermotogaceae bacterium]|nr:CDP-diacylglycerol--glycerol-3-phosphate 3-phosphatidyltransferase [Thermotogaceae bacterium]